MKRKRLCTNTVAVVLGRIDRSGGIDACWFYPGKPGTKEGYMRVCLNGKYQLVHRLALESHLGRPLLPDMCACHSCDNPPCCNWRHLFEGTRADNNYDSMAKGRRRVKLDAKAVRQVRKMYSTGDYSCTRLGYLFCVSGQQIYNVVSGKTRRSVL